MNIGQKLLTDAISNGLSDMTTVLYGTGCIVVLLVLRMIKVSLDNAGSRGRAATYNRVRTMRRIGR
jgi:hypothetical protein